MPTQKDLKRLVRRRMKKTGESYTSARAQLVKTRPATQAGPSSTNGASRSTTTARKPATRKPAATRPDYAKLAGMSDAAIKAGSGCTWEKWVGALDYAKAHTWPHKKIAEYVHEKFKVPGWWTQTVTVGYERIKGLREIGQRRGGSFEATKSRTFAVPMADVFDAFTVDRTRKRWLPGVALTIRKATAGKSVRITWPDGTSVEVWLTAKSAGKSAVSVQHRKLPDRESAARMKEYWNERLEALEKVLNA